MPWTNMWPQEPRPQLSKKARGRIQQKRKPRKRLRKG